MEGGAAGNGGPRRVERDTLRRQETPREHRIGAMASRLGANYGLRYEDRPWRRVFVNQLSSASGHLVAKLLRERARHRQVSAEDERKARSTDVKRVASVERRDDCAWREKL
jgi:hypothetical protein